MTVRVSYSTGGSGYGQKEVENGDAHFGASDAPYINPAAHGLTQFPTLAGAVALVFNLGPNYNLVFK